MNKNFKCPKCEGIIEKGEKFCSACGTKLEEKDFVIIKQKKEVKIKTENNKNDSKLPIIIITAFITFAVCVTSIFVIFSFYFKNISNSTSPIISSGSKNVTITDTGIADAVDKVYDSVVIVKTYKNNQLYSLGTGFVFEKDNNKGYILTNNHVVETADKITVAFTNKKEIETKLVGKDSYSDVAVLSVDASNVLAVAEIGNSESVRIGDTTFAVGGPIDSEIYSWSVTRGILSGKNREVEVSTGNNLFSSSSMVMEVLQTDTPINSGNSGGPLCNANGEVIGITNMKLTATTVEGIGFAIPIETAITYAEKFINGEDVKRPYLGVAVYFVSPKLYNDVKVTGVYIEEVEDNSTAKKEGLKKGDIITKINGVGITSAAQFKYQLYKYSVGDKIKITYVRNNNEKEINVELKNTSSNN